MFVEKRASRLAGKRGFIGRKRKTCNIKQESNIQIGNMADFPPNKRINYFIQHKT